MAWAQHDPTEALISYQTRSSRTETLLLEELGKRGLDVERVDPAEHHPEYRVCPPVGLGGLGWVDLDRSI